MTSTSTAKTAGSITEPITGPITGSIKTGSTKTEPLRARRLRLLGFVLLAAAAGLLLAMSFAPVGWWFLAPFGVGLFALCLKDLGFGQSALIGFVFGLALFSVTISFVSVLGIWIAALLVIAMSGYGALLGIWQRYVLKLKFWPLWIGATWTLVEAIWQRFPLGGFGWIRLGFTTVDQPLGGYLWLIGVAGTGFLVGLSGGLLAWMADAWLTRTNNRQALKKIFTGLGIIFLLLAGGAASFAIPLPATSDTVSIGMVQGNVDGSAGPRSMGYARSVTNNHLSETITLMAKARTGLEKAPDFVLWPENSTDNDPTLDPETAQTVKYALDIAEKPIFVGAVMRGPGEDERQTSGVWFDTSGQIVDRYDKQNAVPFGEYTPMKDLVFTLVPMARAVGAQTVPGTEPGVLDVKVNNKPFRLGDIICYELAYDNTIYEMAAGNPATVVVQSNNATYTGTFQPKQQFAITRVRAMEMRREIVVATTSSYSGLIDAKGRVLARTDEATAASATFTVPIRDHISPGVRLGPILEIVLSVVGIVAILAGIGVSRRRGTRLSQHE